LAATIWKQSLTRDVKFSRLMLRYIVQQIGEAMSRIGKIDRAIIEHLIDAEALMRIDGGVQPSKFRAKRHVDAPWRTLAQVFSKEPAVTARGNVLTKRKVHRRCPHPV
jgi:hypothetical protein